jgi:hypothetical protein
MNKAYVLKVDGTRVDLDHQPTLEEAQTIVGGWVEQLPYNSAYGYTIIAFGDEEGKLKKKPLNIEASMLVGSGNMVVGDVLVIEGWKGLVGD